MPGDPDGQRLSDGEHGHDPGDFIRRGTQVAGHVRQRDRDNSHVNRRHDQTVDPRDC